MEENHELQMDPPQVVEPIRSSVEGPWLALVPQALL